MAIAQATDAGRRPAKVRYGSMSRDRAWALRWSYFFLTLFAIFFLLLISLSEHLGFAAAYTIASASCVALNGYYVAHVLKSARRGALFGLALSALYGLLYVLLRVEDHALLMGSLLVFACVASAMVATRRVDWYTLAANPPATEPPAERKPA